MWRGWWADGPRRQPISIGRKFNSMHFSLGSPISFLLTNVVIMNATGGKRINFVPSMWRDIGTISLSLLGTSPRENYQVLPSSSIQWVSLREKKNHKGVKIISQFAPSGLRGCKGAIFLLSQVQKSDWSMTSCLHHTIVLSSRFFQLITVRELHLIFSGRIPGTP